MLEAHGNLAGACHLDDGSGCRGQRFTRHRVRKFRSEQDISTLQQQSRRAGVRLRFYQPGDHPHQAAVAGLRVVVFMQHCRFSRRPHAEIAELCILDLRTEWTGHRET